MGVYKRGKTWWMSISVNGKQVRRSTGTDRKELAQRIYYKAQTSVTEGQWFESDRGKHMLVSSLIERYMAAYGKSRDAHSVKKLLPAFGHLALQEITSEHIEDYRQQRLRQVKPATVYQELSLMRRIFNVALRKWRLTKNNPAAGVSFSVGNSNARDRWLSPQEQERLLEHAESPSWLHPLLMTALHTGMRKGEILALRWQDIDIGRGILTVQKSKNGEKRGIPLSDTLREALQGFKLDSRVLDISGKVFPATDSTLRSAFSKALAGAGIEDFRFHDLRHTFATRLVQGGVDLYRVQKLLGHKSITMTMRYSHHHPESLRSSVAVLDGLSQIYHNDASEQSSITRQDNGLSRKISMLS